MRITFDKEKDPGPVLPRQRGCRLLSECMVQARLRATYRPGAHTVAPLEAGIVKMQEEHLPAGHQHNRGIAVQNRTYIPQRAEMT